MGTLRDYFYSGKRLVQVVGDTGMGKTSLAIAFANNFGNMFPGGICYNNVSTGMGIDWILTNHVHLKNKDNVLQIIDDAGFLADGSELTIPAVLRNVPNLYLLLVTDVILHFPGISPPVISLTGLNPTEFNQLLSRYEAIPNDNVASRLHECVDGSPQLGELASECANDKLVTLEEFIDAYQGFHYSPIVGPDGESSDLDTAVLKPIVVSVTNINEELLRRFRSSPEMMRHLAPRKFEELVAELLTKQGYSIELTPASKDGGFDMYAAKHDALGKFLYLVECKRYNPPNKVGVHVIRSLHGVVQQRQVNAGIVITTSFFTKEATEFSKTIQHQLQLQDYFALKKLLGLI